MNWYDAILELGGAAADELTGEGARIRAAEAQRKAAAARGQKSLTAHRPGTAADAIYDVLAKGYGKVDRLLGATQREADQAAADIRPGISHIGELITGGATLGQTQNAIRSGNATAGDYASGALMTAVHAPVLSVLGDVGRGAKALTPLAVRRALNVPKAVKAVTPAVVKRGLTRAKDYLKETPELVPAEYATMGGHEVSLPGMDRPSRLRVAGTRPRSLAVPGAPSTAAPVAPVEPVAPRPTPVIPPLERMSQLPERPKQWWPDKEIEEAPLDPAKVGWMVRDRGDFADPDTRWEARQGERGRATYHPTEEEGWEHARAKSKTPPVNYSPEAAARQAGNEAYVHWGWDDPRIAWLEKGLTNYYKTKFGTDADPMLPLVEAGAWGHLMDEPYNVDDWQTAADNLLGMEDLGNYTVPYHASHLPDPEHPYSGATFYHPDFGPKMMEAAPWLAKYPATDPIYSMSGAPDLFPFMAHLSPLMNPAADVPANLRIDPAKIKKFPFEDAITNAVGYKAHLDALEAARAAEEALRHKARAQEISPALSTVAEIPAEKDPQGRDMRWVEIKPPDIPGPMDLRGYRIKDETDQGTPFFEAFSPTGKYLTGNTSRDALTRELEKHVRADPFRDAMAFESELMEHCVGDPQQPYCRNVLSGQSKILSLRDKDNLPYVTLEVSPPKIPWETRGSDILRRGTDIHKIWQDYRYGPGTGNTKLDTFNANMREADRPPAARIDWGNEPLQLDANGNVDWDAVNADVANRLAVEGIPPHAVGPREEPNLDGLEEAVAEVNRRPMPPPPRPPAPANPLGLPPAGNWAMGEPYEDLPPLAVEQQAVAEGQGGLLPLRGQEWEDAINGEWVPEEPVLPPAHHEDLGPFAVDEPGINMLPRPGPRRLRNEFPAYLQANHPEVYEANKHIFEPSTPDILQISGKGNFRPTSDLGVAGHLQDFIRGTKWGKVRDLHKADMYQLPDERRITYDQADEAAARVRKKHDDQYKVAVEHWNSLPERMKADRPKPKPPRNTDQMFYPTKRDHLMNRVKDYPDDWDVFEPYFKGFRKGGPVRSPRRQFEVDPGLIERALLERAEARYPFIRRHDPLIVEGTGEGQSETWPIGETGTEAHPRPPGTERRLTFEVRGPGFDEDALAGEALHFDPRANAVRRDLMLSLTPEQIRRLKRGSNDYGDSLRYGQSEERALQNATDGLMRGYTVGQWPGVAEEIGLTENQRGPLDNLGVYMRAR